MQQIIGLQFGNKSDGKMNVCFKNSASCTENVFDFRVGQEEIRNYKQNHNLSDEIANYQTNDEPLFPYSFTLSTETCMNVHGVIVMSLFFIAILRYK